LEGATPPLFCLLLKNTWQKLSRYYNQRLSEYDLTVQKSLLLLEIPPEIGRNPRLLAKGLDLENSSISGLLDRLEKQGLIRRQPDPSDRRGVLIYLTPAGAQARQVIKALVEEIDRKLQEALSTDDIKFFRRIMTTINKKI